jgi:ubiquinone/menaquinone biosynthesis C-methylase UbiE
MSLRGRLFAALYDRMAVASERAGLAARRRGLLAQAEGRVLEVGAGTGLNLEHYPRELEELVLTEPEEPMARRLEAKLESGEGLSGSEPLSPPPPTRVVRASAEALPFEDASFDTVVCTLALCTIADPTAALAEFRRVLRPGGRLLFLEHVRSDDPKLGRWQDSLNRPWRWVGYGCNCNRRTLSLIESMFELDEVERGELPKSLPLVRPLVVGRATAIRTPGHS